MVVTWTGRAAASPAEARLAAVGVVMLEWVEMEGLMVVVTGLDAEVMGEVVAAVEVGVGEAVVEGAVADVVVRPQRKGMRFGDCEDCGSYFQCKRQVGINRPP